MARRLLARLLDLAPERIGVVARGFAVPDATKRRRLERITNTVAQGYRSALRTPDPRELAQRLTDDTESELRGFAFEGAGLALQVVDAFLPHWSAGRWPRWGAGRWSVFAAGAAQHHVYMVHVGAGLALGRLRRRLNLPRAPFDPLLGELVADGYGFHAGYFGDTRRALARGAPSRVARAQHASYDQGLGRSLWFCAGADARLVAQHIESAAPERRGDLWSGIGLAVAYAGAATSVELTELQSRAAERWPHLAQGAAFAAEARERAGNPAPHTDLACRAFAGCSASLAAGVVRDARGQLAAGGTDGAERAEGAYARWQALTQARFAARARVEERAP